MMLLCKWMEISGWFHTPALRVSYAGCDSAAQVSSGQAGPRYLSILSSSDQLLNPTRTGWFLKQWGLSVDIFVQHKVWTLCFVSLVVFTTRENNNFRNKAKCSYLNNSGQVWTNMSNIIIILPSQNRVKGGGLRWEGSDLITNDKISFWSLYKVKFIYIFILSCIIILKLWLLHLLTGSQRSYSK